MIYPPDIPPWWRWFTYINPVYWYVALMLATVLAFNSGHLRTLDTLMASQFGDQTTSCIVNPSTLRLQSIPTFIEQTYGWAYSDRFLAYGILWAFNLVMLVATAVGLGKINFTRR